MKVLSSGKFRGISRISDDFGTFQMIALDQRNSLRKMLISIFGDYKDEDLVEVKSGILRALSRHASAVLVDGEYALPSAMKEIYPRTGVILSLEKSGYTGEEKLGEMFREDAVEVGKKWGVDAVKLLIYWSSSSSESAKDHQRSLVRKVGERAKELDLPFILEILTFGDKKGKTSEILSAMKEFSGEDYGVDLYKIEPFTESVERDLVFEASGGKPFVILSGGMDIDRFLNILELNVSIGASGFLAGRVIWKDCVKSARNQKKLLTCLERKAFRNLSLMKSIAKSALPWYETPWFGGFENLEVIG